MKFITRLEKNKNTWIMLFILIFFFLLRFPSLFEPYWYGDEGVYQAVGMAIKDNRLLYKDIWDNKPPLIYVIYSIFNSDQFAVRTVSLIFGLLSVFIFFLLAQKLFQDSKESKIHIFATIVFTILFGLPLIEGNIANAENFMLLPILLAALLILNIKDKLMHKTSRNQKPPFPYLIPNTYYIILFLAGLLLGIAFLFKVVAVFDFAALLAFIAIIYLPQRPKIANIKQLSRQIALFPIGFFIPLFVATLFFLVSGGFKDFLHGAFIQNIVYVAYGNKFIIPQGLLILKLILLSAFIFYIFKIRKALSPTTTFILVLFAFSLFNAFFSQRPYGHYLLVLAPSFSLMLGLILWDKKYKKAEAILLLVATLIIFNYFSFFQKSISYYQNFIDFITNKKSVSEYQAFFDRQTPIDYEVALFLKSKINNNDSIFVWGNNPQLYKIVGVVPVSKYVTSYHTINYKEGAVDIVQTLQKTNPRFIVITSNPEAIPFSLFNYSAGIRIGNVVIYERVL